MVLLRFGCQKNQNASFPFLASPAKRGRTQFLFLFSQRRRPQYPICVPGAGVSPRFPFWLSQRRRAGAVPLYSSGAGGRAHDRPRTVRERSEGLHAAAPCLHRPPCPRFERHPSNCSRHGRRPLRLPERLHVVLSLNHGEMAERFNATVLKTVVG